jgi:hypothetical protein
LLLCGITVTGGGTGHAQFADAAGVKGRFRMVFPAWRAFITSNLGVRIPSNRDDEGEDRGGARAIERIVRRDWEKARLVLAEVLREAN